MHVHADQDPTPQDRPDESPSVERGIYPRWFWCAIPLLATAAYLPALWIGFLSDDLILLTYAKVGGLDAGALLPNTRWPFYRPVGVFATWQFGWQLWGFNPLPYHLLGLLLHALICLVLGLWLAEATSNRLLGWLTGALLAVFPLHVEAVGWLAAQWDLWAALFGFTSLWLFTKWWHARQSWQLYALALLSFLLGIFSKESLIAFLPVVPLSIWLLQRSRGGLQWRTLLASLIPFGLVLLLNIGLRIAYDGPLGYPGTRQDYANFFWDSFASLAAMLVAPVNAVFLGKIAGQIAATLGTAGLLLGLVLYGQKDWKLLLLGLSWFIFSVIPVLGIASNNGDLTNSRYLYVASAGYCVILASLIYRPVTLLLNERRALAIPLVTLLLAVGTILSWLNLQPWHVATKEAQDINAELMRLIPPALRPQGMVWYAQNLPDNYAGAFVYRLGLGNMRYFTSPTRDTPLVLALDPTLTNLRTVNLNQDERDAFVIAYTSSPAQIDYRLTYIAGRTKGEPAPGVSESYPDMQVWDFTQCLPDRTHGWRIENAVPTCDSSGLTLAPQNADPQMISPQLMFGGGFEKTRFLRLRVSVRYPSNMPADAFLGQWYWGPSAGNLDEDHTRSLAINHSAAAQVYWAFIPGELLPADGLALRFDPINARVAAQIQWIAADTVR